MWKDCSQQLHWSWKVGGVNTHSLQVAVHQCTSNEHKLAWGCLNTKPCAMSRGAEKFKISIYLCVYILYLGTVWPDHEQNWFKCRDGFPQQIRVDTFICCKCCCYWRRLRHMTKSAVHQGDQTDQYNDMVFYLLAWWDCLDNFIEKLVSVKTKGLHCRIDASKQMGLPCSSSTDHWGLAPNAINHARSGRINNWAWFFDWWGHSQCLVVITLAV